LYQNETFIKYYNHSRPVILIYTVSTPEYLLKYSGRKILKRSISCIVVVCTLFFRNFVHEFINIVTMHFYSTTIRGVDGGVTYFLNKQVARRNVRIIKLLIVSALWCNLRDWTVCGRAQFVIFFVSKVSSQAVAKYRAKSMLACKINCLLVRTPRFL
jgi:hypothetical protein